MPHRAIPIRNRSNARSLRSNMTEAENPRDKIRDAWLRSQGFVVLRFWNNDVLANTNGVIEKIGQALRMPPPPSLTRRGGGNTPAQGAS
jgi:very-short-patch-repair endonuclease